MAKKNRRNQIIVREKRIRAGLNCRDALFISRLHSFGVA